MISFENVEYLTKYLSWSLMILITKCVMTIIFNFIVTFKTFRSMRPPVRLMA